MYAFATGRELGKGEAGGERGPYVYLLIPFYGWSSRLLGKGTPYAAFVFGSVLMFVF